MLEQVTLLLAHGLDQMSNMFMGSICKPVHVLKYCLSSYYAYTLTTCGHMYDVCDVLIVCR